MKTHPAFAAHFEWHKRMTKYFANPTLDAISKHLKREHASWHAQSPHST